MPQFFSDWTFWSFIAAATAILLSQLPPVKHWFQGASIDLEVHSRASLTHKVGNPNAQLHIIITNTGGRSVRIREISASFSRNGVHVTTLPCQNYLESPTDEASVLFTPFTLYPDEEWSHIANFLNWFSRQDERRYRQLESDIRTRIFEKKAQMPADHEELIEAEEEFYQPIIQFFDERFKWFDGEYEMTLTIAGDTANCAKKYTFTIFESDSADLRAITEHYKYGAGVFWERPNVPSVLFVPIHEENRT